ncbi:hypothetical protein LOTGIDRAFT_144624 [Lottia gigantea]|uniref:Transmembrane protein 45B n=1 Tax=Lottia gigantea TaxID=225164 RepID=V4C239_LOTGI|nr:hypothetical protein LOTGIDRAFT_144624 [Lottia gigantea]ESO95554.1 hypothetical protein LOTGIDRAFT_144624 [Lottia gigantea]
MGNFGGHALPGSIFVLISFWHIISLYKRYYRCKRENSKFVSAVWFPCLCLCGKAESWPIEPVMKVILITIALALEIYTGSKNGVLYMTGNIQHVTMYFFFGLASFIDILVYFQTNLPTHLDYAMFFLANGVEFILFRFHLHGRSSLDVLLHTLLLYILVALAVIIVLEMRYRNNLLIALTCRFVVLLQGTWFWQVGSVLYKPMFGKWDQEDHEQMMLIPTYFGVHICVNLLIILLLGSVISCWSNRKQKQCLDDMYTMKRLINTNSHAQTVVDLNDESGEEDGDEFQKAY